ncbi:MAG TPA: hypothetical protein VNT81_06265 [Vicinamibacterales bacterium]|nr:hypothetical protein [Vicinamibacterales bacterium]
MAFAIAGALVGVPPVSAQQAKPPAGQAPAKKNPEPVTGEMVSLNTSTKTLIMKTAPETEMKFSYSDDTVIVGVDKGIEGLTGNPGVLLTVTYDEHGTANIALKIEVKPKP